MIVNPPPCAFSSLILALVISPGLRAQTCEGLEILSAFVNPFNDAEVLLLSENSNSDSIYDYPSWHMVNASGDEIGAEVVNYFGLWDMQWHVVSLNEPWPAEELAPQEMTWVLWSGFNEVASCVIEQAFEPRTWAHADTGPEGCAPLRLELTGPGATASGWAWTLTDDVGSVVAEASGSFSQENGWYVHSDSLCLSQHMCHELTLTGIGGPVFAQWVHASQWHGLPGFSLITDTPGESVSAFVDLYGEDCGTTDLGSMAGRAAAKAWPNPTDGRVHVPAWQGRAYEVLSLQGERLGRGVVGAAGEVDLALTPDGILLLRSAGQTIRIIKMP